MYHNVEYNLRELRSLYLQTDLGAAAELRTMPEASGPQGNAIYQELRKKHARAAGIDYPDLTEDQLKGGMYDWHVFPNTVFLVDFGTCIAYRARPSATTRTSASSTCRACGSHLRKASRRPSRTVRRLAARVAGRHPRTGLLQHVRGHGRAALSRLRRPSSEPAQEMTIWNYHRAIDEFLFGP